MPVLQRDAGRERALDRADPGQAREGVEKGFAEARKILDGMGMLKGRVAEDIDSTYDKIQAGLQGLQQDYAPKTPTDSGSSMRMKAVPAPWQK